MSRLDRISRLGDFGKILTQIWKAGPAISLINIVLKILLSVFPILLLFVTKELIDLITHFKSVTQDAIIWTIIWLIIIQIVNAGVMHLSTYITGIQQQLVTDFLSRMVIEKAIAVELEYYENPEYHNTLHLAQHQAIYKAPLVVSTISQLIESTFSIAMLSALFFTLGWVYAVALIVIAIPIVAIRWYNGKSTYLLEKKSTALERQSGYLNVILTTEVHAKEVRAFGFGTAFLQRFIHIRRLLFFEKKELNKKQSIAGFCAQVVEIIVIGFMYFRLAMQAVAGAISIGGFVLYFQAFQRLQSSLKTWLQTVVQLYQSQLFLGDIFAFLDLPAKKIGSLPVRESVKISWDTLQVDHLSFTYPNTSKEVLHDLSFSCKAGELIAFVGENGSGKSSLVKLLCRLYTVENGRIRIGTTPIQDLDEKAFREHLSVVFQDFGKYYASVTDNIQLGFGDQPVPERIVDSALRAGADAFIRTLPLGYKTVLGRSFINSEELSGGQWQKLAVARAFYRMSEILILDEPTSHIDPVAEYELIRELRKTFVDKITILITHRLHNLKMADRIYVMEKGRIIEQGTFDSLIALDGRFKEMYSKQQL